MVCIGIFGERVVKKKENEERGYLFDDMCGGRWNKERRGIEV